MGQITLQGVQKSFGPVHIIKGADLDIADGSFVVFVGPSGCGKTTLLRLIAGLEDVTGGAILLGGCSANATTLTLVFGLVRASEFDFVHRSARPAAAREHTALHRPHLRHNLSWVESVGLAVGLEGRHCNLTLFEHAALAVCPLHPSHLDVSDAREHNKVRHRNVAFWHANPNPNPNPNPNQGGPPRRGLLAR